MDRQIETWEIASSFEKEQNRWKLYGYSIQLTVAGISETEDLGSVPSKTCFFRYRYVTQQPSYSEALTPEVEWS